MKRRPKSGPNCMRPWIGLWTIRRPAEGWTRGSSWRGTEHGVRIVLRDETKSGSPAVFVVLSLSCHTLASSRLLGNGRSAADLSGCVSQSDTLLFDPHRLKLRLDGSSEIRILFRSSIKGGNGAIGERHDYRLFTMPIAGAWVHQSGRG
jgi:hypothetical protein